LLFSILYAKKVKKGLMQELLTKGIGHTKFKMTEIGEIPEEWDVVNLKRIAKVQGGYAFSSKNATKSGTRWFKIANVSIGKVKWDSIAYLPESFLSDHNDFVLHLSDIVIAMTRPVLHRELKIAMIGPNDTPALLNQRVGRLQLKEGEIYLHFLYNVMQSVRVADYIEMVISGSDPPNVSSKQLESILIQVPPLSEQKKIASILVSVDAQIQSEKSNLHQLQQLKKGLMQDLLTGKVMVTV